MRLLPMCLLKRPDSSPTERQRLAFRYASLRSACLLALLIAVPAQQCLAQANAFGVPSSPDGDAPAQPQEGFPPQGGFPQPGNTPAPFAAPSPSQQPGFPQQPYAGQPNRPPQAVPQPGGSMSIEQYIVSRWHGQTSDNDGQWDIDVSFRPDGVFYQRQTLLTGQFHLELMGRYQPTLGPNGGVIAFTLQQWQPRQVCNPSGCQPLNLPQYATVPFQMLSRDSFRTQFGTFQRVGPPG